MPRVANRGAKFPHQARVDRLQRLLHELRQVPIALALEELLDICLLTLERLQPPVDRGDFLANMRRFVSLIRVGEEPAHGSSAECGIRSAELQESQRGHYRVAAALSATRRIFNR